MFFDSLVGQNKDNFRTLKKANEQRRSVFCDTNILRFLVEHPDKWENLKIYLQKNNYRLVFSPIQFIEFKKISRILDGLTRLLSIFPSSFTKGAMKILEEEIANYPSSAKIVLFHKPSINEIIESQL
jgi:hypothetical protein